jgi:hypothetical protein
VNRHLGCDILCGAAKCGALNSQHVSTRASGAAWHTWHRSLPAHLASPFSIHVAKFAPQGLKSCIRYNFVTWDSPNLSVQRYGPLSSISSTHQSCLSQISPLISLVLFSRSFSWDPPSSPSWLSCPSLLTALLSPCHALVCLSWSHPGLIFTPEAHTLIIFPSFPSSSLLSPPPFPVPTPYPSLGTPPSVTLGHPLAPPSSQLLMRHSSPFLTLDTPFSHSPCLAHTSLALPFVGSGSVCRRSILVSSESRSMQKAETTVCARLGETLTPLEQHCAGVPCRWGYTE